MNNNIREKFLKWEQANYMPQRKLVAEAMGVNYFTFIRFATGTREVSETILTKINNFIEKNN